MLDHAACRVLGGQVAWHCETDPAAAKVLAHHWPRVPNHGDITTVDWAQVEPVDVLVGGFPCTDVSTAGKRRGLRPGTRSGLWSHMAYAVDQLRPALVVAENVRGLLSADAHSDLEPCPWCVGDGQGRPLRALGAVLADLADLGYDAVWCGLRAADVGAAHARFRVFLAAAAHADREGRSGTRPPGAELPGADRPTTGRDDPQHLLPTPTATRYGNNQSPSPGAAIRPSLDALATGEIDWSVYTPAVRRWETAFGRPAPPPTIPGRRGGRKLNPDLTDWMMGWPQSWTDVPGVTVNDRLRIAGNGVVPQQAEAALRWLLPHLEQVAA